MTGLRQDLRLALRMLARNPGLTTVATLTLALALGANTAVFSVMNGVLLRALPYPEPDRLVDVSILRPPTGGRPGGKAFLDSRTLAIWRESRRTVEQVAGYQTGAFTLTGSGQPRRVPGARVHAALFPLLRVPPLFGRTFSEEDQRIGAGDVVVLSHGLWQRRFAGDRGIVGQTLTLDGEPHAIVAVMPPSFFFPDRKTQLWVPLGLHRAVSPSAEVVNVEYFPVVARLEDDVSPDQVEAEVHELIRSLGGPTPESVATTPEGRVRTVPLHRELVAEVRPALVALFAAVGLVLLIGCTNLATLLLARGASREREMAICC